MLRSLDLAERLKRKSAPLCGLILFFYCLSAWLSEWKFEKMSATVISSSFSEVWASSTAHFPRQVHPSRNTHSMEGQSPSLGQVVSWKTVVVFTSLEFLKQSLCRLGATRNVKSSVEKSKMATQAVGKATPKPGTKKLSRREHNLEVVSLQEYSLLDQLGDVWYWTDPQLRVTSAVFAPPLWNTPPG